MGTGRGAGGRDRAAALGVRAAAAGFQPVPPGGGAGGARHRGPARGGRRARVRAAAVPGRDRHRGRRCRLVRRGRRGPDLNLSSQAPINGGTRVPTSAAMTTIAAVQSAFPAYRYRQAEFARIVADQVGLDPAQRARLEQLYSNAGVDNRHTILPMAEYGALGGIGPANDRYIEEATDLGGQALRGALDAAGLAARDVDLLIVTSVTGVAV